MRQSSPARALLGTTRLICHSIAILLLAMTPRLSAEIIYDSFPSDLAFGASSDAVGTDCFALAVPFTPRGLYVLDSLTVAMSSRAGGDPVRLTVRPDAAGIPADTVLDTIDLGNLITAEADVVTAPSVSRPLLHAGLTYWVVAQQTTPQEIFWWHVATTPTYGRAYQSTPDSPWYLDMETAYALRVQGAPVLEPTSVATLALAVSLLLPRHHPRKPL